MLLELRDLAARRGRRRVEAPCRGGEAARLRDRQHDRHGFEAIPSRVLSTLRNGGFQFRPIGACHGSAYVTARPTGSNQRDANRRALMTTSTKGTALVTGASPCIVKRDPARNRPLPPSRVSGVGSDAHRRPRHIPHHQEPLSSRELPMLDTLRHVIEAHGGLKNWNQHQALSVDLVVGGMLWGLKEQAGKLERTNVTVGLGEEWASHQPFAPDNRRTRFSPDRVAIEDAQGNVLEELAAPRASFAGHTLETPWTEPQLAYFAGYAMWTYL